MKKLILAVLAFSTFTACNNDRNDDDNAEASIVGTWKVKKWVDYDGATNEQHTEFPNSCYKKTKFIYRSDNTFTLNEHKLENNSCIQKTPQNTTYTYDSSTNNLTFGNNNITYKVLKLNDNELELSHEGFDENEDGTTDKVITYYYR